MMKLLLTRYECDIREIIHLTDGVVNPPDTEDRMLSFELVSFTLKATFPILERIVRNRQTNHQRLMFDQSNPSKITGSVIHFINEDEHVLKRLYHALVFPFGRGKEREQEREREHQRSRVLECLRAAMFCCDR